MIRDAIRMDIAILCTSQVHMGEEGAAGVCEHYTYKSICHKNLSEICMVYVTLYYPPKISLYMLPAAKNETRK